jgi:hypothetical protein
VDPSLTDRTYAVIRTPTSDVDHVFEDNFHDLARAIVEPLRENLLATCHRASPVENHSDYGLTFDLDTAGGRVQVLLQWVDPWLLTLSRHLSLRDRFRRVNATEVESTVVAAVDAALGGTESVQRLHVRHGGLESSTPLTLYRPQIAVSVRTALPPRISRMCSSVYPRRIKPSATSNIRLG